MENKVLDDIKKYAVAKMQAAYGTVGVAENNDFAQLHSFLGDTTITIKLEVKQD